MSVTRGSVGLIASTCFSSLTSSTILTLRYCTRSPAAPTKLTIMSGTSTKEGGFGGGASACASSPWPRMKKNQPAPAPRMTTNPTTAMMSLSLPLLAGAASAPSAAPSASLSAIAPPDPSGYEHGCHQPGRHQAQDAKQKPPAHTRSLQMQR